MSNAAQQRHDKKSSSLTWTPEPWHVLSTTGGTVRDADENIVAEGCWNADAARIVACVNALAGLNPEAVAGLVAAVEAAIDPVEWATIHGATRFQKSAVESLLAALATLKGGAK